MVHTLLIGLAAFLLLPAQGFAADGIRDTVPGDQLSDLRKLVKEFRSEIVARGVDVNAVERDLYAASKAGQLVFRVEDHPELVEMPMNHWAYESMRLLYKLGILQGYPTKK